MHLTQKEPNPKTLENEDTLYFDLTPTHQPHGMHPGISSYGMEADPPRYLCLKCECFLMTSDWCDINISRNIKILSLWPWPQVGWLCWGLTSQSTIFQSCRDGAIASWVINQSFRGVKCLAQGHNTAAVGFEPRTSRSGVRHSTTEPPRSPWPQGQWGMDVGMVQHKIVDQYLTSGKVSIRSGDIHF